MRRLVIATLSVALVVPAAASADAARTGKHQAHAKVTPRTGVPSTRFAVRFRNPERTGSFTDVRIWETVSAIGPKSTTACSGIAGTSARSATVGARLQVRLAPRGKPWCPGPYIGTVSVFRQTRCRPGAISPNRVCPLLSFAPERIGRFRFTVSRAQP